ncbi:MAG: GNAT family N-acetyltransferase [Azospirillaceae bacterium]
MAEIVIRDAGPDDAETMLDFIRDLAVFEREPDAVSTTAADLRRFGWGAEKVFDALIAELDGQPVGFALFFRNFSTWEGRPGFYLEDLYVTDGARGHGIGLRLVARIARKCLEAGGRRLDLAVLDWNPARDFYDRIGFRDMADWRPYRLTGSGLRDLAAGDG